MQLQQGDWVRTEKGEEGKVVMVSGQSAFIKVPTRGEDGTVVSYLLSQLTKIDPPKTPNQK